MKAFSKFFGGNVKKVLAVVLTLVMIIANFTMLFSFTTYAAGTIYSPVEGQGVVDYEVKASSPAIPMNTNTQVHQSYLEFEIDGTMVEGSDVTIAMADPSNDGVTFEGGMFTATKKGVYPATVSYNGTTITVYVVVKNIYEDAWYLYNEDFTASNYSPTAYTGEGSIATPAGWAAQYVQNYRQTTLSQYTTVGVYRRSQITEGVIPFYDTYWLGDQTSNVTAQLGQTFTLNNEVVNSFADYTISMESQIYNHWPDTSWAGVGLFGRAPTQDGLITNITGGGSDRFTLFAVNNAYKGDGSAGTFSGNIWYMTFGDGFYNQASAVIGQADNVNKALNNTGIPVDVSMSLKYDGNTATYTVDGTTVTQTLTDIGDTIPNEKGSVGVAAYQAADGSKYDDITTVIKQFNVALNNTADNCPAYAKMTGGYLTGGVENYTVTTSAPAIPVNVGTSVDISAINFEIGDATVNGDDVTIECNNASVTIEGGVISVAAKGVYKATVTADAGSVTVYIVAKELSEDTWYIYQEDFTGITATSFTDIPVPAGWVAQGTEGNYNMLLPLFEYTNLGANSKYHNATGIIPIYDPYWINEAAYETQLQAGFFTLTDSVVSAFSDYTINMDAGVYSHHATHSQAGVGLYGRLPLGTAGKINKHDGANNRFVVFMANPGAKADGTADTKTGQVYARVYDEQGYQQGAQFVAEDTLSSEYYTRYNTQDVADIPMSLKFEGNYATYTAGNVTYNIDLTTMPEEKDGVQTAGAVGVYVYTASDNNKYDDTFGAIKQFSVALNNTADNCPAYEKKIAGVISGGSDYTVTAETPAIPVNVGTSVDISAINFEIGDATVNGDDVTITCADANVTIEDGVIIAAAKGVYKATVTADAGSVTVYIVAKELSEDTWYLYNEEFTAEEYGATDWNQIAIPAGWAAQYAQNTTVTNAAGSYTHVAPYSYTNNITTGVIPFYDAYWIGVSGSYNAASFTLNDAVVKAFADYTISMESRIYNHWPNTSWAGVGLFGRAPIGDNGIISNTSGNTDRFTAFAVNNAATSTGADGTYSRDAWWMTLGDGYYAQKKAVLEGKADVNVSLNNSNNTVPVNMSLKYAGTAAYYTVGNSSYELDLSTVNDDNYTQNGAVGIFSYGMADGSKYHDIAFVLEKFTVALNNTASQCPTYEKVITATVNPNPEEEFVADAGSDAYTVTAEAPAIPVNVGTYVDLSAINFEIGDATVNGDKVTITCADPAVKIAGGNIYVSAKGIYEATVNGSTVYIVAKELSEDTWYIYYEDFTTDNYAARDWGEIEIPANWAAQYATDTYTTGTSGDKVMGNYTHVAPYSFTTNSNKEGVEKGIIPFYDTYWIGDSAQKRIASFTLSDDVVKAFADYTISAETQIFNHQPETIYAGVGLFGRAPIGDNDIISNTSGNSDRFTAFAVNNAATSAGADGTYSRDAWWMTLGDGYYAQGKAVFNGKADVNVSLNNSNTLVPVDMSLKYAGSTATYTVGNSTYTLDLSTANDDNYTQNGAVGIFANNVGDYSKNYDMAFALEKFTVALNNTAADCPAYAIDTVSKVAFDGSNYFSVANVEGVEGSVATVSFNYYIVGGTAELVAANGATLATLNKGYGTYSVETFADGAYNLNAAAGVTAYVWGVTVTFDGVKVVSGAEGGLVAETVTVADIPYIDGDANRDTVVNVLDLIRMKRHALGESVEILLANTDLDSDGAVKALDITSVKKIILNLSNTLRPVDPNSTDSDNYTLDVMSNMGVDGMATSKFNAEANAMLETIENNPDTITASGDAIYVSNDGSDSAAGTQAAPLATIAKAISKAGSGDVIYLNRGDLWRETGIEVPDGVSIAAYGTGPKPAIYGSSMNYAEATWTKHAENIWKVALADDSNIGNVILNHGQAAADFKFTLDEVVEDYDFYSDDTNLYLYLSAGNPAEVCEDIEFASGANKGITLSDNSTIQNIRMMYFGGHAIWVYGAGLFDSAENNTIDGVVIGYTGGSLQPGDVSGWSDIRYGNGVELWGSGEGLDVTNCHVYQTYDSAVTVQYDGNATISDINFSNNLLDYNLIGVEYWLEGTTNAISNLTIDGNIIRYSGYGWTELTRPDAGIGTAIKGYSWESDFGQENINITNNYFDLTYAASYHKNSPLVSIFNNDGYQPFCDGNTYAQYAYKNFATIFTQNGDSYWSESYGIDTFLDVIGDAYAVVVEY